MVVMVHMVSGSLPGIETAPIPTCHPLTHSDLCDSARSVSASSYVTFSRLSKVSVSVLQQLQHSRDAVGGSDGPLNCCKSNTCDMWVVDADA